MSLKAILRLKGLDWFGVALKWETREQGQLRFWCSVFWVLVFGSLGLGKGEAGESIAGCGSGHNIEWV